MLRWEACKVAAAQKYWYGNKIRISTQSRDIFYGGTATDPTQRHAAGDFHYARSSGGPLRIDSQASTGISNVKTMTSR